MMPKRAVGQSKSDLKYSHTLLGVLASFCLAATAPAQTRPDPTSCDSRWHNVPAINKSNQFGDFNSLNAVAAVSPADVWAVGQWRHFDFAGKSYDHPLIEHWDGKEWKSVASSHPRLPIAQLNGVSALSSNDVWAVGYESTGSSYWSLIEHWDGTTWTIIEDGDQVGWLTSVVAISHDDVWAVGSSDYIGYGILAHWNGQRWRRTYIFDSVFLRAVTAINGHDAWAVGQLSHDGSGDYTYAVHFDGNKWSVVPTPSPLHRYLVDQNWLTSISALATDDVWAVGLTRDVDTGIRDRPLTEHWDGKQWKVVPTPALERDMNHDFWSVVARSPDDVWAAGSNGIDFEGPPLIEHWNGFEWTPVAAAPAVNGGILGLTGFSSHTELWGTGYQSKQNLFIGTLVQHFCAGQ